MGVDNPTPNDPPDDINMLDHQQEASIDQQEQSTVASTKKINSFREVVENSSQWFAEARKIITSSTEWEESDAIAPEGKFTIQFNKNTLDRLRAPWKLTLMGKCLGINIRPSYMETRVRAMWRIKGSLEVIDLGKQVYLFKFTQPDDYERVLFGGLWFILDH